jgi:hypothetical protein
MKSLNLEIQILKDKISMLENENNRLKMELQSYKQDWIHPQSCLHNEDPWEVWKRL